MSRHHRSYRNRCALLASSCRSYIAEPLECRTLLAAVAWDGGGDGTNWSDPLNWDTDTLPGALDDVTINIAANPTILHASGTTSILSLNCDEAMTLSGGSLTVNAGASAVTAALTITGGTLRSTGAGTTFTANGAGTVTAATLRAEVGGQLALPQVTGFVRTGMVAATGGQMTFAAATSYDNTTSTLGTINVQATGANSRVNLSNLSTFTGSGGALGFTNVTISGGGRVDLDGVLNGRASITLSDAASVLDVATVTAMTGVNLTVNSSASVTFPLVTSMVRVGISTASGGQAFFPAATSYDNSTLTLGLINVTASGTGSRVDLSNLATLAGGGGTLGLTIITASGGGQLDIAGAMTGRTAFNVSDATTIVNADDLTSMTDVTLTVNASSSTTFGGLTDFVRVNLVALTGGQMFFPAAETYDNSSTTSGTISVTATGTGSRIDLSALGSLTGSGGTGNTAITASAGGQIDLGGDITSRATITVDDAGSNVTFDEVTSLAGITIIADDGATMTFSAACDIDFAPGNVLRLADATSLLSIDPAAVFDILNNELVIDYFSASPLVDINALVTSGYAGGAWNGDGINSSVAAATPQHAVGYAESAAIFSTFPATFAGQQVDETAVLLRYVRYGDANLDLVVNLVDYNRVASNFFTGTLWSEGNFNFDNVINISDFNRLAANFALPLASGRGSASDDHDPLEKLMRGSSSKAERM